MFVKSKHSSKDVGEAKHIRLMLVGSKGQEPVLHLLGDCVCMYLLSCGLILEKNQKLLQKQWIDFAQSLCHSFHSTFAVLHISSGDNWDKRLTLHCYYPLITFSLLCIFPSFSQIQQSGELFT